eukprot:INCI17200.2.p1 GENE.INCI17200.2~~INCI17200.2.p1  ORF type:complete len:430 (-),score=69.46 INCI17200.2:1860-3149(-)
MSAKGKSGFGVVVDRWLEEDDDAGRDDPLVVDSSSGKQPASDQTAPPFPVPELQTEPAPKLAPKLKPSELRRPPAVPSADLQSRGRQFETGGSSRGGRVSSADDQSRGSWIKKMPSGVLLDDAEFEEMECDENDFESAMVAAGFGALGDHSYQPPPEELFASMGGAKVDVVVHLNTGETGVLYDVPLTATIGQLKQLICNLGEDGFSVPLPRDQVLVFEGRSLLDETQTLGDAGGPLYISEPRWHVTCLRRPSSYPREIDPSEWVPDSAADGCQVCGHRFGAMRRRHHCRQCGRLICSTCSSQSKLLIPHQAFAKSNGAWNDRVSPQSFRVCLPCAGIAVGDTRERHSSVDASFKELVRRCIQQEGRQYLAVRNAVVANLDVGQSLQDHEKNFLIYELKRLADADADADQAKPVKSSAQTERQRSPRTS